MYKYLNRRKAFFFVFLFFLGFGLGACFDVLDINKLKDLGDDIDKRNKSVNSKNYEKIITSNEEYIQESDFEKENRVNKELKNFWLEIDNLNIKAPIVLGTEDEDLENGLGLHTDMYFPDEKGNVVISGHRWKNGSNPYYRIFENLDKLNVGDKIKIFYNNKLYEYEVFESSIVDDSKEGSEVILKEIDDYILTIYTCTPKYTSDKRLYFRAKRIKIRD